MTDFTTPRHPLPEPCRGSEIGSFANRSITVRWLEIARRMLADNITLRKMEFSESSESVFTPEMAERVEALIREIPASPLRSLQDEEAPDFEDWAGYLAPYKGQDWLQPPWFFAEYYFYRRILEATGYFQPGAGQGFDPFEVQKRLGLETNREGIQALCARLETWLDAPENYPDAVGRLLLVSLWGNQSDLSIWPVSQGKSADAHAVHPAPSRLLVDDVGAVTSHLLVPGFRDGQVDIVLDNAGFELVCDLALADFLLSDRLVEVVQLHAKSQPTFVSDVMVKDIHYTLDFLEAMPGLEALRLAQRLRHHVQGGRLHLLDDLFWTSPLSFWEMSPSVRQSLVCSKLVITKGDANYRRLLGDRHWPFATPFAEVVQYLPTSLLALRVLKSEVVVGLGAGQIEGLDREDPQWLTDGKWGLVQFFIK